MVMEPINFEIAASHKTLTDRRRITLVVSVGSDDTMLYDCHDTNW